MLREAGQGEEGDGDDGLHCCAKRTTDHRPQRETAGATGWTGREGQGVEAIAVLYFPRQPRARQVPAVNLAAASRRCREGEKGGGGREGRREGMREGTGQGCRGKRRRRPARLGHAPFLISQRVRRNNRCAQGRHIAQPTHLLYCYRLLHITDTAGSAALLRWSNRDASGRAPRRASALPV